MYNFIKERRTKVLLVPLILYWLLIFIGTSLPSDNLSTVLEVGDKVKHFIAYFVLAILLGLNFHFQERWQHISVKYLLYTLIVCATYGLLDELHQMIVPNRSAEFLDWLADLFGSTTGVILLYFFIKIIKKRNTILETN